VITFERRTTVGKMTFEQATLGQSGIITVVEKSIKETALYVLDRYAGKYYH
jgi:hypothetical protein